MSFFFHKFNLRNKLLLLAALPLLVVSIIGITRTQQLLDDYQAATNNRLTIKIVTQIAQLVFELQKERGMSLGYANNQNPLAKTQLIAQRNETDKQLAKLIDSPLRAKFTKQVKRDKQANTEIASLFTVLDKYPKHIYALRKLTPIDTHLAYSVEKTLDLYSKSNDELLALIGLLRLNTHDAYQSTAYSDLINLLKLQELAGQERGWLNQIIASHQLLNQDYLKLKEITTQQTLSLAYAQSTPIIQHASMLDNMLTSIEHEQIVHIREKINHQMDIIAFTEVIELYLGNGRALGNTSHLLHDYLYASQEAYPFQFHQAKLTLDKLKKLDHLSSNQQAYINILQHAIDHFALTVNRLHLLKTASPSAINQLHQELEQVQSNLDTAIIGLKQPELPITQAAWWQLASDRIEKLHAISNNILQEMDQISLSTQGQARTTLIAYILTGVCCLGLFVFVTYQLVNVVTKKISAIAHNMQLMAENPDLNLQIISQGEDELAHMGRSLNHMIEQRTKHQEQQALASAVFEYSSEAILVTNADNQIELVNPAFSRITGYSQEDILGHNPSILASKKHTKEFYQHLWQRLDTLGHWEGEIWNKRKDGQIYPEYLAITRVLDNHGQVKQYIGLFMDISNRKQYEKDIWYQSNFDSLTSLPNRKLAKERIAHELRSAQQGNTELAILLIDIDNFKYINDIHGHGAGDHLLVLISQRLTKAIGELGFVARVDGDAFLVLIPEFVSAFEIEQIALNILAQAAQPIDYLDESLTATCSIGIAFSPYDGDDESTLTRNAETAMFQAKEAGRNTFKCFTNEMDKMMRKRFDLEKRLRKAVLNSEFKLQYQPIVKLDTGKVTGVEALIRWHDPDNGLIPPDNFIPLAEETGLILPIGNWIIDQALHDLARWQQAGLDLCVSINLSGVQCKAPHGEHFIQHLKETIKQYRVKANKIRIEITESTLMEDSEQSLKTLESIKNIGASIYIDDFGTGYSSLSYLKQFPISVIKIDRSFVDSALESDSDANLIKAIITMGKSLNMRLVAEGVETKEQWQYLSQLGCNYAQGYLIAKPLDYSELITWARESKYSQQTSAPPSPSYYN